jgi:hypothetical protein
MATYSSAVELTVQEISRAGKSVLKALVTPTATDGNKFLNDGRTMLRVKNGSAAPITVSIKVGRLVDGLAVADRSVAVAAIADPNGLDKKDIGPFIEDYDQIDGYVWAVCSAVTDVLIGAYRLPKT